MHDRRYVPHAIAGAVAVLGVLGAIAIAVLPGDDPAVGLVPTTLVLPPTTAPTIPAMVATRRVLVDSVPSGAQIWRDGQQIGVTPITFDWVPGQPSLLELRLERHGRATLDLATAHDREVLSLPPLAETPPPTAPVGPSTPRIRGGHRADPPPETTMLSTEVAMTTTMATGSPYERFE